MSEERMLILGAAGRDFHNFNVCFRDDERYRVVAFTGTQIPGIAGRRYPFELSGSRYPQGIPIIAESELSRVIHEQQVSIAVFSYSDVSHRHVMHLASQVTAAGADFWLLGAERTMLAATCPVVAICAVRTGCGKSQTSRYVAHKLRAAGKKVVVLRHPMPYGDLAAQAVQRFATYEDLETHQCTIEEREEYELHLEAATVVYAGVDYGRILQQAQAEADVLLWDGGNNDTPFVQPDLWITVVDPLRPGHELAYHPGETNLRAADVIVVNKVSVAKPADVETVLGHVQQCNRDAAVVQADSELSVEKPGEISGKRVVLVEDGPTVTHGSMLFGAAKVAAERYGAAEIVDPRPVAVGSIAEVYEQYPHLGPILPAMGYSAQQIDALRQTIEAADCDLVLYATPIDLQRLLGLNVPTIRVRYELKERGEPTLAALVAKAIQ